MVRFSLKDKLYRLLRGRHLRMWESFLAIPKSQIRICLYIVHHGNKVTKEQVIKALSNPNNPLTIERNIYRALQDHILVQDQQGYLSVKNPVHFVVKIVRGNILDSWRALSIATSLLALFFSDIEPSLSKIFIVLTFLIIIGWFIDDFLHETHW
jgi:hypothetical protein